MKLRKTLLAVAFVAVLGACNDDSDYQINTISPAGAPALAYWDHAGEDDFITDSTTTNVSGQFNTNNYDAIVFDSINALRVIKNNDYPFKLARFLTGGNFYFVSYDKGDALPTSEDNICSFNQTGLPTLVFEKLINDYYTDYDVNMDDWTWYDGVNYVQQALINHSFDYYFIAQPALQAALTNLGDDASKVTILANLRDDWYAYSGQSSIPQAAVFIRDSAVENHLDKVKEYLDRIDNAIDSAIDNPSEFKTYISENSEDNGVDQFGFNCNVAYAVQSSTTTPNGFGLVKKDSLGDSNEEFTNAFLEKLDNDSYPAVDSSLFLDL